MRKLRKQYLTLLTEPAALVDRLSTGTGFSRTHIINGGLLALAKLDSHEQVGLILSAMAMAAGEGCLPGHRHPVKGDKKNAR